MDDFKSFLKKSEQDLLKEQVKKARNLFGNREFLNACWFIRTQTTKDNGIGGTGMSFSDETLNSLEEHSQKLNED